MSICISALDIYHLVMGAGIKMIKEMGFFISLTLACTQT